MLKQNLSEFVSILIVIFNKNYQKMFKNYLYE